MDFLYKKHPKGTYEHAIYRRKVDILVMVVMFALALGLYIIGRVTTGTNANLLTIVAVLGLLPACKMVVDVIMCFRLHPCDDNTRAAIDAHIGALYGVYNMYFTSYDKNYMLKHLIVTDNSIIGYSSDSGFNEKAFINHLNDLLRKEGIKDVLIKVFNDLDKYTNRLDEINGLEIKEASVRVARLIMDVTL